MSGGEKRQCVECGTTETPLWRTGPMGPKTFCNACGVRWKKKTAAAAAAEVEGHKSGGAAAHGSSGLSHRSSSKKERVKSAIAKKPAHGREAAGEMASTRSGHGTGRSSGTSRKVERAESPRYLGGTSPAASPTSADDLGWDSVVRILADTIRSSGNPSALMVEEYRRNAAHSALYQSVFSGLMANPWNQS
mmetsp:Transcript_7455/g.15209  ORF Transcript_7455/g.15209 Transcript_7455/m.15209 type:complete len:191 (+) Transcript_7455:91-663(+)